MTTPFDLSEINGTTTTNIFITSERIDHSTIISEVFNLFIKSIIVYKFEF